MEVDAAIDSAAQSGDLQVLKPTQLEAIRTFASGHNVSVALPSGHGKSLCFILLPLVFNRILSHSGSIVLCVSPDISYNGAVGEIWHIVSLWENFSRILSQFRVFKKVLCSYYISPESLISNPQWREILHLPVYQERTVALVVKDIPCTHNMEQMRERSVCLQVTLAAIHPVQSHTGYRTEVY